MTEELSFKIQVVEGRCLPYRNELTEEEPQVFVTVQCKDQTFKTKTLSKHRMIPRWDDVFSM
jgi:hypothetical protein